MRRIAVVFVVLILGLSVGLWLKVREEELKLLRPSGGSGIVEGKAVDVSARLGARISTISKGEGDAVVAGEVLVTLHCPEQEAGVEAATARLQAAQRAAEAARAQADAALGQRSAAEASVGAVGAQKQALLATQGVTSRTASRMEKLQGQGGATVMDLERASTQVDQLNEQIRALDSQVSAARGQALAAKAQAEAARANAEAAAASISAAQSELRRMQALQADCTLVAPQSGYIETRAYEPGEVVLPGARLLSIVSIEEVEATFYLPGRELARVAPGRPVKLSVDAYPDVQFPGHVVAVSPRAEFTPRNVQTREDRDRLVYAVKIKAKNEDGRLRPGMPVEVSVEELP